MTAYRNMPAHQEMTPELHDEVERYALGAMSASEALAFEAHAQICTDCRTATEALVQGFEGVAELMPASEPSADLWSRVQERIAVTEQLPAFATANVAQDGSDPGLTDVDLDDLGSPAAVAPGAVEIARGVHFQAAGDEEWLETRVPGLRVRPVWVDAVAGRVSVMARLEPGTVYPTHVHQGLEECIVLKGDLWVGDEHMGPGDYQVSREGSEHALQRTDNGCLLFLSGTKQQLEEVLA